ncbi:ATP-binding protein [Nocardia sp. NPDC057455]|uniref:sensor histidine kinase n=1 Tax=Nocardia sp. NPDC057455 TaxID=3346138 RepID=UPI003671D3A6
MDSRPEPSWVGRLTVQGWFLLVLGVMVVFVLAGAGTGAGMISQTKDSSNRLIDQLQPAVTQTYRLQGALISQETGVRGYAIAAEPGFLAPYEVGRDEERRAADRLRTLLADHPALLTDLDGVLAAAQEWRRDHADPVITAPDTAGAARRARDGLDAGEAAFDVLRARFVAQNAHLEQARDSARADLVRTRQSRDTVLTAMVAMFVATSLVLTLVVRRLVTRPLAQLTAASLRVADGDFDHHIDVTGPADLFTVAEAVELMRRRVVADLESSRATEAALVRQAADLDAQAEELRRSNQELEQFAYVASHDLQEPLRKVASFCQLIEKRYNDSLDDRGRQYIEFAVDGAHRMQVLINDLLAFSRVGRVNQSASPVSLDDTLDRALHNIAAAREVSGAVVHRPEHLPQVVGDATLLTQLWQNLLANAIKFTEPDTAPVIDIDYTRTDTEHRISVADNGIGIGAEFAEKVFVIFQRLHGRDEYTGTGIGLAICRKIVEFHGGRIWIDTDYTDGARFTFTLSDSTDSTDAPPRTSEPDTE